MNIIFLTLERISSFSDTDMYSGLMRKFREEGHKVYIVSPMERYLNRPTNYYEYKDGALLRVKILNMQKANIFEKGLSTLLVNSQYKNAIKKYFGDIQFDLITYSTPPISFANVVKYLKKNNPKAITYLQLKDIFPQNAVDLGMFSKASLFYKYFRKKEVELYKASDFIGCMSPANVKFVLEHNDFVEADNVEVSPNSIALSGDAFAHAGQVQTEKFNIRNKYGLPTDKPIFIYGGNLGRPQGIDYLIKCLDAVKNRTDSYFVVVGSGTEFIKLDSWYKNALSSVQEKSISVKVMHGLPKTDYDMLVKCCDVGLIFLDHRFTIPNYPSRLLSYLENKMPIICATDVNTDIGPISEHNGYGYWCESVKPADFVALVDKMLKSDIVSMGVSGYRFLCENYLVENTYKVIMKHFE